MTSRTLPEKDITVIVSILQGMPSSFDPSIHKRLDILARSQHPTRGKQNDQSTGMEQSVNNDDHSSISGSEYIYICSCYRCTTNGLKCEMQTCDVLPTRW